MRIQKVRLQRKEMGEYPEVELILEKTDYYEILGINRGCSDDDIRRGYKKMAMKVHPDRCKHPRATEAFQKVSHVYQVLSDEKRRTQYDQFGEEEPQIHPGRQGQYYGQNGTYYYEGDVDPDVIFNMFFGNIFGPNVRFQYDPERREFRPTDDFRRRQREQREAQKQNMPFYLREGFFSFLFFLFALFFIPSIFKKNDDPRTTIDSFDIWNRHIVFDQLDRSRYYVSTSDKYRVTFGLDKSWIQRLNDKHRIDSSFYRQASYYADIVYKYRLNEACNKERYYGVRFGPNCKKLRDLN